MTQFGDYVTANEAAEVLRLHPETVKRLCRQGELPATKLHNTWLIRKDQLAQFAQEYSPKRGPGSRFRRLREEAERYTPRQLPFTPPENREEGGL